MNIITDWLKKYGDKRIEQKVKLNLRLSCLQLNSFIKKGNDVKFNGEKCEIVFIDKKTCLIDLWSYNEMSWYMGIEPFELAPERV